jgi:hypothetical protein
MINLVTYNNNVLGRSSSVGDSFDIPNGLLLDVDNFLYVAYALPSIGDINEV